MAAPLVLVTADRRVLPGFKPGVKVRPYRPEVWMGEAYIDAVRAVGGVPLLVPPGDMPIEQLLDLADAVLLTGGDFDIHPSWYGEAVTARIDRVEEKRTSVEIGLARGCLARNKPVLGICGGMQALAVAAGGRLIQDVKSEGFSEHEQPTDPATPWHDVLCTGKGAELLGERIAVNSTHHQAVREPGEGFEACGHAPDGLVELIVRRSGFAVGLQWHPELLGDLRAYQALIDAI